MKTTNKIQKTALTAALAAGFSILGFSIDAQVENKLMPEINPANNLAMVTAKIGNNYFSSTLNTSNLNSTSTFAAYLEKETEAPLSVENWMMDDSNFSEATSIETEIETPMEIENWMLDENTFIVNSVVIETATDEQMELEDWMLNENKFEVKNNVVSHKFQVQTGKYIFINNISFPAEIKDKNLQLEDWMTDSKIWK
jgi:hypothetical protein